MRPVSVMLLLRTFEKRPDFFPKGRIRCPSGFRSRNQNIIRRHDRRLVVTKNIPQTAFEPVSDDSIATFFRDGKTKTGI